MLNIVLEILANNIKCFPFEIELDEDRALKFVVELEDRQRLIMLPPRGSVDSQSADTVGGYLGSSSLLSPI